MKNPTDEIGAAPTGAHASTRVPGVTGAYRLDGGGGGTGIARLSIKASTRTVRSASTVMASGCARKT